ncbi:MAG: LysR family transcriptional regulator [Proteobacteria bacterium]|nr:LysR family transcriptional regulator [Pseudomonadota bacterium]
MTRIKSPIHHMASPSDIQYFVETAQTLNFSRAADRLGIAQPSLTQAMQRLELALGESVFDRHKRGVTLTPAGKHLLSNAKVLLQTWESVRASSQTTMKEIKGRFTIGCHPSVALYALGQCMPKLLENPHLEIHLVHDLSRKITEQVINSSVDIGIVVNPIRHPDLIISKIYDDEVTFWATSQVLSKLQDKSNNTIIFDPNIIQSAVLLKKAAQAKIVVNRTIESSNLEVVASLTASGCGIGILPTRVAKLAHKPLVKLKSAPIYKDEVCLISRIESKKVASIQYICKTIKGA